MNNGSITVSVSATSAIIGNRKGTISVTSGGSYTNSNRDAHAECSSDVVRALTWTASTDSDLAGYKDNRATASGTYGEPIAIL